MPVTTGTISALSIEGTRKLIGDSFRKRPLEFKEFYNFNQAPKGTMTDREVVGIGTLNPKSENSPIILSDPRVGRAKNYTMTVFAGGIRVSWEGEMDELYGFIRRNLGTLGAAMNETMNVEAARFFDKMDSAASPAAPYLGFDGLAALHLTHTDLDGSALASGIYAANRIATTDFSASALQTGYLMFENATDASGNRIVLTPASVWGHPNQMFLFKEILQTSGKVDSADNNINSVQGLVQPKYWHYVTDQDQWVLQAKEHDANFFMRAAPVSDVYDDKSTLSTVHTIAARFHAGSHGDWRGFAGSSGNP